MKLTCNIVIGLSLMLVVACKTTPVNKDKLAGAANSTVEGTIGALDTGTGSISDIDNAQVNKITKSESVANASDPVSDQNLKDAALSPLEDLNIRRRNIPELLLTIDDPYAPPADQSCVGYGVAVAELDSVLGTDYDHPDVDLSSASTFANRAKDVSLAGVNAGAGLFIPGRGVIKEATGAGTRERYLRALYQRGVARRGYLKGTAVSKGC